MRVEGSSYLPVIAARGARNIAPVQHVLPPEDERRHAPARSTRAAEAAPGFDDAMMNVSVPDRPVSSIAMLYEVQRLAQYGRDVATFDRPASAAIAYADARRLRAPAPLALPATRI